jgi:acyl-CoA synthetase (NDP forming)
MTGTILRGLRRSERAPYTADQLRPLIAPASVAIIGASDRPESLGARVTANLDRGALAGAVQLVNPRRDSIGDRPCASSITEIGAVDCAIVAVPMAGVLAALEECAESGVRSAVVYASGFAETATDDSVALQQRMSDIAAAADMRICGPNCVGLVNLVDDVETQFLPAFADRKVLGPVGVVVQSGALGYQALQAQFRGAGFTYGLMPGNSSDVDVVDFMNFLVDDPSTRAIATVFEGLASGERFREVARRAASAGKAIVAQKLGSGEVSQAAAVSHTGSMIGSRRAFQAAFERLGVIAVEDHEAVVETAQFFARAGRATADGVGIVSGSGGAAILAAERAEAAGLQLPQPGEAAKATLAERVPSYGSIANPADLTSGLLGDADGYRSCVRAFADDEQYGIVVFPQTAAGEWITRDRAPLLCDIAAEMPVPLAVIWMSEWLEGPGAGVLERDPNLSVFRSARRCFEALHAWQRWSRWLEESGELASSDRPSALWEVSTVIDAALEARPATGDRVVLDEVESMRVISLAGLKTPPHRIADTLDDALAAAADLGFPVVLKALARDLPHKARIGGVEVGIEDRRDLERAYVRLREGCESHGLGAARVLVEPMVGHDAELIVGGRRDPHFRGLVLLGLGGSAVEEIDTTCVDILPVGKDRARRLADAVPTARQHASSGLLNAITGVGRVLEADPRIEEIDVNPLVPSARGEMVALDCVVTLRVGEQEDS